MIEYIVKSSGEHHTVKAVKFTQGDGLTFIGVGDSIVAIFTSFEWLKVVRAVEPPVSAETPSTEKPELDGE